MFKKRVTLGIAMALLMPLAACAGGTDPETSGGAEAPSGEPLQFYLSGDTSQGGGYAKLAAEYTEETGVEIEVVDLAYDDLAVKVKNAALANDLPALARMPSVDPTWIDQLADLSEIGEKNDVMMDLAKVTEDGEALSLPSDLTAVGLYLNKTLWDEAGETWPTSGDDVWTWDEYVAATKRVQEATGAKYGMVMDRSSHRLKSFLFQFGSELWLPNDEGVYETNDATQPAIEYFKTLNDDSFMPRSVWLSADDPAALFKSGQVASYYSGSWQIASFDAEITDFEWVSVRMPAQPVRATMFGNAADMVVFEETGQTDEALAFVDWLYTPENYTRLMEYSSMLPASDGIEPTYSGNQEAFDIYIEEISVSPDAVGIALANDIQNAVQGKVTEGDPIRDETVKYLNDEVTIDEAMANISEQMTDALS